MKKILIIDDDEIFIKTLEDSLPMEKYEVFHVNNGEDGLKEMDKIKPDLIILDLLMPKMGGLDFLKVLEKKEEANKIPILISSQLSKMKDISEGVTAGIGVGVKGYIIKSAENIEMITKEIKKVLGDSV
jgi:CheY-like chemotaxis protein